MNKWLKKIIWKKTLTQWDWDVCPRENPFDFRTRIKLVFLIFTSIWGEWLVVTSGQDHLEKHTVKDEAQIEIFCSFFCWLEIMEKKENGAVGAQFKVMRRNWWAFDREEKGHREGAQELACEQRMGGNRKQANHREHEPNWTKEWTWIKMIRTLW